MIASESRKGPTFSGVWGRDDESMGVMGGKRGGDTRRRSSSAAVHVSRKTRKSVSGAHPDNPSLRECGWQSLTVVVKGIVIITDYRSNKDIYQSTRMEIHPRR